ncbi:DEAD/DEAH box helicase [Exiguobacterium sp.]|uniref:DEAD/DEAH box helicase n=2 Tax=Exiguobacterium sp. TaxID=44751 RepID=UPI00289D043C|nr:DEAD/DEAH box helicase [Exiguobacterium sp.]
MNYGLSERKIKQMSDAYAFRRGKKYVAARKVTLHNYRMGDELIEASVDGEERFTVTVRVKAHGVDAGCNCPSLAMDTSFCGHIVAVLLAMHHVQAHGTPTPLSPQIRPFSAIQVDDAGARNYLRSLTPDRRVAIHFELTGPVVTLNRLTDKQQHQLSLPYFDRLLRQTEYLQRVADVSFSPDLQERIVSGTPIVKLHLDRTAQEVEVRVSFDYQGIQLNPLDETIYAGRDQVTEQSVLRYLREFQATPSNSHYVITSDAAQYAFLRSLLDERVALGQLELFATQAIRTTLPKGPFHPRIEVDVTDRLDWLVFNFSMDGIPEDELKRVLKSLVLQKRYHRLKSGQFVSLEARAFQQLQRVLAQMEASERDLRDGRLVLPAVRNMKHLIGASILHLHADLLEKWIELKSGQGFRLNLPNSLESRLYPYQRTGIQFLKNLDAQGCHGILADEMGLGKTIQAIGYIATISDSRALIVAPASLLRNWEAELKRFLPGRPVHVVTGSQTSRLSELEYLVENTVTIVSYTMLRTDVRRHPVYDVVFFDEAQHLKNPQSQTVSQLRHLQAKRRFALTGTPLENRPRDIWSIFHVLFPELLPDLATFEKWSFDDMQQFIQPFLLRREKIDVLQDLPKKQIEHHYVELGPNQKRLYASYLAKLQLETLQHLDETKREDRLKLLAGLTRLRQICNDPGLFVEGYTGEATKRTRLLSLIAEKRAAGKRILIFSQYTQMLERIRSDLAQRHLPHFLLTGETPLEERVALCDRFNDGEVDLFLISLKAGGTGLNLATADTVILFDSWWNPAVEQQAADRAHRLGQQSDVTVIKLLTRGTIEEKMTELQDRKAKMVDAVLTAPDSDALTVKELVHLVETKEEQR